MSDGTLTLEPQAAAHAAAMFEVLADPAIYEYENSPPESPEWLTERFHRLEARQSADGREQWLNWVIRLPTAELIGYVQATVYLGARAGIAYELNSRYWHRGLASRAVKLMIDELAGTYRAHALTAVLKRSNARSMRLLVRAGFMLASPELHAMCEAEADEWLMLRPARIAHSSNAGLVTLSPAQSGDFESLLQLRIDAMRESLERIGRFDPARARERFAAGFSPQHTRHIEVDGQRAGFFMLKPHTASETRGLSLDHLYLHPSFQRRQIGSTVLAHIFAEADLQRASLRVGALRESRSNAFYARHGFQSIACGEFDNDYLRLPSNRD